MQPQDLARYIDHTLLKADATATDITRLCEEAIVHRFYSVCVNSANVALCKKILGARGKITSVVGFPLGAMSAATKAFETQQAIADGADEIDMVVNIGAMKSGLCADVQMDISAVVRAAGPIPVKVILETAMLNEVEKVRVCEFSRDAGAAFVKTCTGFGGGQATVDDVKLMKQIVGPTVQVKASGGIKTFEQAVALIEAGATRLGTSSGLALVTGGTAKGGY